MSFRELIYNDKYSISFSPQLSESVVPGSVLYCVSTTDRLGISRSSREQSGIGTFACVRSSVLRTLLSAIKSLSSTFKFSSKQDGPYLESSSYLNVSLRYLGPWDPGTLGPLDLGTLGPWDSWTSSLLQHLLILPHTSFYLLLCYGLVMGGVGGVSCNIGG